MHIYLRHPKYGTKVAVMEMEAAADEERGWERYDPDTASDDEPAAPANALEGKKRRKSRQIDEEE